jgi:hemolysin III
MAKIRHLVSFCTGRFMNLSRVSDDTKRMYQFPEYSLGERIADGCIHVLGVGASLVAAIVLIVMARTMPTSWVVSIVIYSVGLVAVFAFSASYNLVNWPPLKAILRRFDHAAIYLKIAGTYTPFAVVMGGVYGYALLTVLWLITIFGMANKLIWPEHFFRTSNALYLAEGWSGLFAIGPMIAALSSQTLLLILIGGFLYSIGIIFHISHRLPYHNAIWHGFVLAASACHYAAVVSALL